MRVYELRKKDTQICTQTDIKTLCYGIEIKTVLTQGDLRRKIRFVIDHFSLNFESVK